MPRRIPISAALAAVLGIVVTLVLVRGSPPPGLNGQLLDPPLPAPDVDPELRSPRGPVRLSELRGRSTILFFGYTHCPDVCPLTLARLAEAVEGLDPEARERLQVVMISVDPERDTPEVTDRYARRFHPGFRGLAGDPGEVARAAAAYGIFHGRAAGEAGEREDYYVDHTASVLLLDPDGGIRLIWGQDASSEAIASDLAYVL